MCKPLVMSAALLLVVGGCSGGKTFDEAAMIGACTRTLNQYNWLMDHPGDDVNVSGAKFAELFTEDATLILGDSSYDGRSAIADRYRQTRTAWRSLTMSTEIIITPLTETEAIATSYQLQHLHKVDDMLNDRKRWPAIAEIHDQLVIQDGRCRFIKRESIMRLHAEENRIRAPLN